MVVEDINAEGCHSQLLVMEAGWYVPNGVNDAIIVVNTGSGRDAGGGGERGGL